MAKQALIVFVKEPKPGKVKTRLTPDLNPQEASDLYTAFIKDSFVRYSKILNTDIYYFYYPNNGLDSLKQILPNQKNWHDQSEGDLGEKMHHAFETVLNTYKKAVIVGSDHPDLPNQYLKKAFDVLDYVDLSIGPSQDGGYYCIGLKKPNLSLFEKMIWSVEDVYAKTMERILKNKLEFFELPVWNDVDSIDDLNEFINRADLSTFPKIADALKKIKSLNFELK